MNNSSISVRDLLAVIFKYQRMIVAMVLLTLVLVVAFAYWLPERYEAKAKLLIKPGRQNTQGAIVESQLRQQLTTNVLRKEDIASEAEIIRSRMLIERALADVGVERMAPLLKRGDGWWATLKYAVKLAAGEVSEAFRALLVMLGLMADVPADKHLVISIEKQLNVQPVQNSDVIDVSFRWPLPEVASEFTTHLVERYIEHHVSVHKERNFFSFVRTQTDEIRDKLTEIERVTATFKAGKGIVVLAEQRSQLLTQRSALESALQREKEKEANANARLSSVSAQVDRERSTLEVGETEGRNPVIDQLRIRLATLELEEREASRRYDENSVQVHQRRQAVAEARRRLEQETQSARKAAGGGSGQVLGRLREEALRLNSELKGHQASVSVLQSQLADVTRRLAELESSDNELGRLARDRLTLEGQLRLYEAKQEELRLAEVMDQRLITSVAVIQPAAVPIQPVRMLPLLPNRIFFILAGLLGSLVIGAALAFMRDYLDPTLDTILKVEVATAAPVLASLPQMAHARRALLPGLAERLPPDARVLVLCSAVPGEGVSTVAKAVARSLVLERGKRVLVIDCNFRDSASAPVGTERGLSDVAAEQLDTVIRDGSAPGLQVISRGTGLASPSLFDREGFAKSLRALATRYDYVLLDAPAVLAHPDALVLARAGADVLLVVDSHHTRAEVVAESVKRLRNVGARVAGVIMNFRRFYLPAAIYRRT